MTCFHACSSTDASAPESLPPTDQARLESWKSELRHQTLARRRTVRDEDHRQAGAYLATVCRLSGLLDHARTIAAYVSMGTEVPTLPLLRYLTQTNARILVPVLGTGMELGWAELHDPNDLHDCGPRRPAEPEGPVLPAEAVSDADVIITAALLANHQGIRLGRGGGWYDRMLALRDQGSRVVSVVWPWEFVDQPLPHEPHDQLVDGVLTPKAFTACPHAR